MTRDRRDLLLETLARTTGPVIVADDDSWWEPSALEAAADLLDRHPEWAVLVASLVHEATGRLDPMVAQMQRESPVVPGGEDVDARLVSGFHACAAVVRRDAFLRAGGFDPVVFFAGEEERLVLDLV